MLVQGSTLGSAARLFGFSTRAKPKPLYNLELITMAESDLDLMVFDLPGPQGAAGPKIQDLQLPQSAVITLITRGAEVVSPKGQTRLNGWDQVTVLARVTDEKIIRSTLLDTFQKNIKTDKVVIIK